MPFHVSSLPSSLLETLPSSTLYGLHRLASLPAPAVLPFSERRAGVLVALFLGRKGDIYVLLTRRSDTLRTYAGDTALPGGKMDKGDRDIEATARREAFEEVGLPDDEKTMPHLATLAPFLSRDGLLVTPVIVLVLDNSIIPILNYKEVHSLFSMNLRHFLRATSPYPTVGPTSGKNFEESMAKSWGGDAFYAFEDHGVDGDGRRVRVHRFLTNREHLGIRPVQGLTAVILIVVAVSAYGKKPEYELFAPGELPREARIIALGLVDHVEPTRSSSPIDSETIEWMQAKPRL